MAGLLVPLTVGPATAELVEIDMVVPRLVERIAELEERLYETNTCDNPPEGSLAERVQTALRAVDRGLHFILGEDTRRELLVREATDKALTITLRKIGQLKSEADAFARQAKEARQAAWEAERRGELALQQERDGHAMTHAQCEEWRQKLEIVQQTAHGNAAEAEAARSARISATQDVHALRSKLADAQALAEDFQRRFLAERAERRRLHEEIQALRGNIRVVCRVRPPPLELAPSQHHSKHKTLNPSSLIVAFPFEAAIRVRASERRQQEFEFSAVFDPNATQEDVFNEVWPVVRSFVDGYNTTLFAYGQTGSGKTHTVMGSQNSSFNLASISSAVYSQCGADGIGIAPRTLEAVFRILEKERRDDDEGSDQGTLAADAAGRKSPLLARRIQMSMLEIYNDVVRDLLGSAGGAVSPKRSVKGSLEVSGLGPFSLEQVAAGAERVLGRTWRDVSNAVDAMAVLKEGLKARVTASTVLNAHSSRSHALLCLRLVDPSGTMPPSTLQLVDLAGSERVSRSEADGQQLKEAQAINKSLSALGDVIAALQSRSPHIPYRNSKLTAVLQDSLGGSSKVLLVCCVAPEAESASETLSTLAFASRAAQTELGQARKCNGDAGVVVQGKHRAGESPMALKTPSPAANRTAADAVGSSGGGRRALKDVN